MIKVQNSGFESCFPPEDMASLKLWDNIVTQLLPLAQAAHQLPQAGLQTQIYSGLSAEAASNVELTSSASEWKAQTK